MLQTRTRDEIVADLKASLSGPAPRVNTSKDTDTGALFESLGDAIEGLEYDARDIQREVFLSEETSTEALDLHAEAKLKGGRKQATTTDEIEDALAVGGTPSSVVPAGSTLVHEDGTRYQVTRAATLDAVYGAALCTVQSIDQGARCNKEQLDVLTFETPPSGIQAEAQLVIDLAGATDKETDGELLARLQDAYLNPLGGGRFSDYRQWALEEPKVRGAYVYGPSSGALTGRRGMGVVDCAVLAAGTGSARIPSAAVAQSVLDLVDAKRPESAAGFGVLVPAAVTQAFDLRIDPKVGYAFDWVLPSPAPTVANWEPLHASGPRLTWSGAALPAGVVAGKRILVRGQMTIVVDTGTTYTTLDRIVTGGAAVIGETIYPAGPLTEPVQAAVRAYMDALGPARGVAADPDQQGWEDSIKHSLLYGRLAGIAGVRDVAIVMPSGTVTPVDHAPSGTVDLLVYGIVTVRPWS